MVWIRIISHRNGKVEIIFSAPWNPLHLHIGRQSQILLKFAISTITEFELLPLRNLIKQHWKQSPQSATVLAIKFSSIKFKTKFNHLSVFASMVEIQVFRFTFSFSQQPENMPIFKATMWHFRFACIKHCQRKTELADTVKTTWVISLIGEVWFKVVISPPLDWQYQQMQNV